MKPSKSSFTFKSFKDLKFLLKSRSLKFSPHLFPSRTKKTVRKVDPENDKKLFKEAMVGVRKISRKNIVEDYKKYKIPKCMNNYTEAETLLQLKDLVKHGKGFIIADTPEYIEGTGYRTHPEFPKRLHRGDFSIQAHIDLHGLNVKDAHEAFEKFLKGAVRSGKRGILIVHGRGLSSPAKPVLKTKVYEWLTSGPWRKWIIAFSSARSYDGGAGATYVLLRQRPLTKRFRKKHKTH